MSKITYIQRVRDTDRIESYTLCRTGKLNKTIQVLEDINLALQTKKRDPDFVGETGGNYVR